MNCVLFAIVCLLAFACTNQATAEDSDSIKTFTNEIAPFLKTHCIRCHGAKEQRADRRFDQFTGDLSNLSEGELLQDVLDQLNLGLMPPDDEPQPDAAVIRAVVDRLTKRLATARELSRQHTGKVVLRRLNRSEYYNTVRDLFQLNMDDFDPTATFPADDSADGFDNIGDALLTSDFLMQHYLESAERLVTKAVRPGPAPKLKKWSAIGVKIHGKPHPDERGYVRALIRDRQHEVDLGKQCYAGVPADGEYIIRVKVAAVRRQGHRYDPKQLGYDPNETARIRIKVNSKSLGSISERIVGEYEVPDNEPATIEVRLFMQKGYRYLVEWANGPKPSQKRIMRKVFPHYHPDALLMARNPVQMYLGTGPELRYYSLELEGPHYPQWPLPAFARFFSDLPDDPATTDIDSLHQALTNFATVAFRRPANEELLRPYFALAERRLAVRKDFWDAVRFGMRAMVCSPSFLYLVEDNGLETNGPQRLTSHELATRLSYFLWSSLPDEPLRRTADQGTLNDKAELAKQVNRMLDDPRAKSLTQNFVGQWLGLRKLGEMPPDPAVDKVYYSDNLESAMQTETELFAEHLLKENASILNFIDSDFTFNNEALARHYRLPWSEEESIPAEHFVRVSLPKDSPRGGLLGQASVLTLTSNGVETQPVLRGVWMLENLLGTPPSSPPPDVDPIEPDVRGIATVRELMAKHRTNATCNECHRKIDPLGLAMENFDHLGRYRERYAKRLPIDASGEMPDGTKFLGAAGIKAYLKARPDQFGHCLTEKLLTYSIGRRLSFTDRADIDRIVGQLKQKGYGMRDLVHLITRSTAFQSK